ncbi:MAG: CRISPR-associated protein Cas4 [Candidatus Micrarchaeaceae archaeon]
MRYAEFWINVNDIKQYAYCARIPFYNNTIARAGYETYGMLVGKSFEDSLTIENMQRIFHDKIANGYHLARNLKLRSYNLMLQGKLDYVLIGDTEAYPIEIKYSADPSKYKTQLTAYAMLIEGSFKVKSVAGYFVYAYSDAATRLEKVIITDEDKEKVIEIAANLRKDILRSTRPKPTESTAKCIFCEFRNFCDDVF